MHIHEGDHHGDHGAGICAKVIFFTLMAILLGLVTLIVLENRGGSDGKNFDISFFVGYSEY